MANVLSVTPVEIETSIGPYRTAILDIDEPLTNAYPYINFNLGLLYNLTIDYFYRNGVGPNFTIGDKFAFEHNGNSCKVTQNGVETSVTTTGMFRIGYILRGTDEGIAMAQMDVPVGNSIVATGALLNLDFWSNTPPTATSFGSITSTYSGSSGTSLTIGYTFEIGKSWAEYLFDHQPVTYHWTAWDQIAGNNGRYRCNLTKINDGVIEDISTHYQRGSTYFSKIPQQSSIMNIIQNSALDVEMPIAYSGNARLTLEVKAGTQSVSRKLVYRFYDPDGTTPLYTLEQVIYLAGTTPTNDVLLMFVHDDNEQAAAFLPVEKVLYQGGLEQFIFGDVSPTETEMLYIWLWLQMSGAGEPEYPYDTGSTDNGGDPAGAQPGDHIGIPDVPTLGGMNTGMFTVYCPSGTQLAQITQFLWSDNVLDNIKKYFNNFADNIIALYVLPCKPVSLPFKNFKVGNMESDTITDVEYITQRFIQIDMGSVYIKNTFDSYLDYSPFTKFEIYLPGIGMQTLSADDIMCPTDPDTGELIENTEGSVISLSYTIDLMTGILVAIVMINGELRYQFPGKIGYSIPLTGENYSNIARGFVTAASGLIGAVATGGLSAPLTAGGVSAAVSGTVNAMKPEIHRGGNLSGDASMLGEKSPYLVYHRPNKPLLKNQERFTGFPSYKSGALSEFSGLTQVIDAHIEGISCTEAERAEILNLLKGGVIL